jgi:hypothetical protein
MLAAVHQLNSNGDWLTGLVLLLDLTVMLIVLTRLGLFALVVATAFASWTALTIDPDSWYFPHSMLTMAVFGSIVAYGFWVSLGNQKVFQESALEA